MSTRASIHGHPIHAMSVALPIGLMIFSFVCDLVYKMGGADAWATVAYYTLAGGLATALLVSVPGMIDYTGLRDAQSRSTARSHGLLNMLAAGLAALSLWLRGDAAAPPDSAVWASLAMVATLGVSGWLGGTLVHVQGVSQPQAPNEAGAHASGMASAPTASKAYVRHPRPVAPAGGMAAHPAMQPRSETRGDESPRARGGMPESDRPR